MRPAHIYGGGYNITSSSSNDSSKLGFCAITNGNYEGFVISGHEGNNMYENFTYGGTTVGYVTATAYYNTSNADAAFLSKGTNAEVTAYCGNLTVDSYSSYATEYSVGTTIKMYNNTSGVKSGTIQSLYYTSVRDNKHFYNQTKTSISIVPGYSGSPVYVSSGNGTCKLLGIISTGGEDENGYFSTFSKYCYIAQALSLSAITDSYFD